MIKVSHVTQDTIDLLLYFLFAGLAINPQTKFEVSSFNYCTDIEWVPKL